MYEIRTGTKRNRIKQRRVVAYEADGTRRAFESVKHCANYYCRNVKSIYLLLNGKAKGNHTDSNGTTFYYGSEDPNRVASNGEWTIPPEDDLPVIMFFKEDRQAITRFKSVTFLASALQRPVKTVYSWLHGERCTDVDCYYKYEKDCTKQELDNMFKPLPK